MHIQDRKDQGGEIRRSGRLLHPAIDADIYFKQNHRHEQQHTKQLLDPAVHSDIAPHFDLKNAKGQNRQYDRQGDTDTIKHKRTATTWDKWSKHGQSLKNVTT